MPNDEITLLEAEIGRLFLDIERSKIFIDTSKEKIRQNLKKIEVLKAKENPNADEKN